MPLNLVELGLWLLVAVIAIIILALVLKFVSKIVSASLRLAIILGSLVVIAVALYVLNMLLRTGGLSI